MDSAASTDTDRAPSRCETENSLEYTQRADDATRGDRGAARREATLRRWAMRRRLRRQRG